MYTTEAEHLQILRHAARDRGSELIEVSGGDPSAVSPAELKGFSYLEHPENIALAVRVCQDFGIPRATAILGMHQARPDTGAATVSRLQMGAVNICFVNAFAANDPQSTESIWNLAMGMTPRADKRLAIVNCRADRPDRSIQLAEMCCRLNGLDWCVVVGCGSEVFVRSAVRNGYPRARLLNHGALSGAALLQRLADLCHRSAMVVGIGNIAGTGLDLTEHLAQHRPVIRLPAMSEAVAVAA